jgi:23S rRNA pseudouridine2605 synthase
LNGKPTQHHFTKLLNGVTIPGGKGKALFVEPIRMADSERDWVKIIIGEGKNRQIRHMFNKVGFDVLKLKRVAIGQLTLGKLRKGEYAFLDEGTLSRIFRKHRGASEDGAAPGKKATRTVGGHRMRKKAPKKPKFQTKRGAREDA